MQPKGPTWDGSTGRYNRGRDLFRYLNDTIITMSECGGHFKVPPYNIDGLHRRRLSSQVLNGSGFHA